MRALFINFFSLHLKEKAVMRHGRTLYESSRGDMFFLEQRERFLKFAVKHSPHYNSIMYAKLCLYEGSINGWGRCNCLKQGISLSLMSRGSMTGLFTFLWWQGAGVIRNTNPLINFRNRGSFWSKGCIAESAAWNNACVICSLTEFTTLI